jgi:hypothetical protein
MMAPWLLPVSSHPFTATPDARRNPFVSFSFRFVGMVQDNREIRDLILFIEK